MVLLDQTSKSGMLKIHLIPVMANLNNRPKISPKPPFKSRAGGAINIITFQGHEILWEVERKHIKHTQGLRCFSRKLNLYYYQKELFFSNILKGPARKYHFNNWIPDLPFPDIWTLMTNEYDSVYRQKEAQVWLDIFNVLTFISKHVISDDGIGCSKICSYINWIKSQCISHFHIEVYKPRILSSTVVSLEGVKQLRENELTGKLIFQSLKTPIEHSITLQKEESASKNHLCDATNVTLFREHETLPKHISKNCFLPNNRNYFRSNPRIITKNDNNTQSFLKISNSNFTHPMRESLQNYQRTDIL